ncbi:MAG: CsgG/HfaB family protein [Thermodesulfovibrionales bacterium]
MLYAICFLLFFIQGCGPTHFVRPKTDVESVKKVAILPFENFTQDDYAGEKIRRIAITELLSRDVDVIEPGEVTRLFREMKIKSLGSVKVSEIQEIGKALNVEAVILGSVEAFGTGRGISVSYPEVTINLRMIEVNSGNIVWSVRHTTGGPDFWTRHFGSEGPSLSEAAGKVVRESIGSLF